MARSQELSVLCQGSLDSTNEVWSYSEPGYQHKKRKFCNSESCGTTEVCYSTKHSTQLQRTAQTTQRAEVKRNSAVMQTAALVIRLLCAHDGRMELEDLHAQLVGLVLKDEVEDALKDTDMFVITGEENKVVVAKTKLRLCRVRECPGCRNLHLCKMYLLGNCLFENERRGCRFCHDIYSGHNVSVRRQHNLLELDRTELSVILLQNDNTLLPPVCFTYNKGRGEYGHCPDKESCRRLHVCEKYIRGTCDGSAGCSRCHDFFEPHPVKTLQAKGVPSQLIGSMLTVYKNILAVCDDNQAKSTNTPVSASEKSEICLFNIKGYCKQGNRCQQVHYHLPYKWESRERDGWKVLPDNEETERAFCDPTKTYSDGAVPVHFDTMTQSFVEVRRLSTLSSVLNPTFILTTTWIWYWEDENGNWIKYGNNGTHHASSITSEDLESQYQQDNSATIQFTAGPHSYELNMQDMIQSNKQVGTKRLVRRRPMFLTAEDVKKIKTSQKESSGHSQNLPRHWDKTKIPETGFKRVLLRNTSDEYRRIIELFSQTMSGFNVKRIERVQNRSLWSVFQWQGDILRKKNAGKENKKLLFHATQSRQVDAICQQNIDWRTCGVHGTAYGKGSYFARDASYSHRYTDHSRTRCMFVCRVLAGEYTIGHPSYVRPPLMDGEGAVFYDSCVNDINNPSIFVVFEKPQVYPEYLIQYEDLHFSTPLQVFPPVLTLHSAHLLPFNQLLRPTTSRNFASASKPGHQNLTRASRGFGSMTSLANLSTHANAPDTTKQQNSRPRRSNMRNATRKFGSLTNLSAHDGASPTLSLHSRPQTGFPQPNTRQETKSSPIVDQSWVV